MRMGVLPIVHRLGPLCVVTAHQLADPVARIAGTLRDCRRGLPLGHEPEDLPPAALVRFFGCPVAPLELIHLQVGLQA
jgi:hypothetical protein